MLVTCQQSKRATTKPVVPTLDQAIRYQDSFSHMMAPVHYYQSPRHAVTPKEDQFEPMQSMHLDLFWSILNKMKWPVDHKRHGE